MEAKASYSRNFTHLHLFCKTLTAVLHIGHWVGYWVCLQKHLVYLRVCVCVCVCVCLCLCVCVCVQFQSGGDPKTGTVVSAQEAQAQAILQQTKVLKLVKYCHCVLNYSAVWASLTPSSSSASSWLWRGLQGRSASEEDLDHWWVRSRHVVILVFDVLNQGAGRYR